MLKISPGKKLKNSAILGMTGDEIYLILNIKKRRTNYLEHILYAEHNIRYCV